MSGHRQRRRHRAKRRRNAPARKQLHLRAAWITFAGSALLAIASFAGSLVAQSPQQVIVVQPAAPRIIWTTAALSEPSPDVFDGLTSNQPDVNLDTIAVLRSGLDQQQDPAVRDQIFNRVASFVRQRAELPIGGTYDYCSQKVAPSVPVEVQAALALLTQRAGTDLRTRLDLGRTNLAFADLAGQRLDNINFNGSLLCRSILNGSTFFGSTFEQTTLRYAVMTGAAGLDPAQLRATYSLCGTVLPVRLRSDAVLRKLEATDPEPHLRCNVT